MDLVRQEIVRICEIASSHRLQDLMNDLTCCEERTKSDTESEILVPPSSRYDVTMLPHENCDEFLP